MARNHRRWTQAEVRSMRQQRAAGMEVLAIAQAWDRNPSLVSRVLTGRLHAGWGGPLASTLRLVIPKEVHSAVLNEIGLHRSFLNTSPSATKIARQHGLDRRTVQSRLLDYGIKRIDIFLSQIDRSKGPRAPHKWRGPRLQRPGKDPSSWPGRFVYGKRQHLAHVFAFDLQFNREKGTVLEYIGKHPGFDPILDCNPFNWKAVRRQGPRRLS
jgi:hypothetical protein